MTMIYWKYCFILVLPDSLQSKLYITHYGYIYWYMIWPGLKIRNMSYRSAHRARIIYIFVKETLINMSKITNY